MLVILEIVGVVGPNPGWERDRRLGREGQERRGRSHTGACEVVPVCGRHATKRGGKALSGSGLRLGNALSCRRVYQVSRWEATFTNSSEA